MIVLYIYTDPATGEQIGIHPADIKIIKDEQVMMTTQTRYSYTAVNQRTGMTVEEIEQMVSNFKGHTCECGESNHRVEIRIGWHSQIKTIIFLCGGESK